MDIEGSEFETDAAIIAASRAAQMHGSWPRFHRGLNCVYSKLTIVSVTNPLLLLSLDHYSFLLHQL
jgi:hypothetical protein